MTSRSAAVVFDFDGSLQVARLSWQAADELDRLRGERSTLAVDALTDWSGAYGVEFAGRIDDETLSASHLAEQLRGEANGWALEWTKAMDQENYNRYQDACDRAHDDRSVVDSVVGFFTGHDDLPPTPARAGQPQPPSFAATRTFADYSNY